MIRITAGELKGREVKAPAGGKVRPSHSRLRQALFNSLQIEVPEARVLDLFSGAGTLAFEALSRGAARVICVEQDRHHADFVMQNARTLGVEGQISAIQSDCLKLLARPNPNFVFDLIFADPPYHQNWEIKILEAVQWQPILVPGGKLVIESGKLKKGEQALPERVGRLVKIREKAYGESMLTTYQMEAESAQLPGESV